MEGFRFETDCLNEYFSKITGKEQFTLEELKVDFQLSLYIEWERISQNDLDVLMTLSPEISLNRNRYFGINNKKC